MGPKVTLDHCVVHVSDWKRSNDFYARVMGAEVVARGSGFAYRFGDQQLNLHGPGVDPVPVARDPVRPGNSDLCFVWAGPIADAAAHFARLRRRGRARAGGTGRGEGDRDKRLFPRSGRVAARIHLLHPECLITP